MADNQDVSLGRYKSAADIPAFSEMLTQLKGFKALTFFIARDQKIKLEELEAQLKDMVKVVDDFYDLLGDRNWIFHEHLNYKDVKHILSSAKDSEDAETQLIRLYNEETIRYMALPANGFPAMRTRIPLIEKAKEDYFAERYYSCVLVLLAIIDGFVNEIETKHKGFHARESTEFSAWDTIISHHKGIERVHNKIYSKSVSKTVAEPVYELYRHGIMHGTVVDFNNEIVATKAWNLLFAVMDWARAKSIGEKSKKPESTLRETFSKIAENQKDKKLLEEWKASSLTNDDEAFLTDKARQACESFLSYWLKNNYGNMSKFLMNAYTETDGGALPKLVREEYARYKLSDFSIHRLNFVAPSICEINVNLTVNSITEDTVLRWIYEAPNNSVGIPAKGNGEWHFQMWGISNFMTKAQLDGARI